jgi:hypothetical protein
MSRVTDSSTEKKIMTDEKREVELEHHESTDQQSIRHAPPPDVKLHHDKVAPEAIGGLYDEMPAGYYWSKDFIGTVIVGNPDFKLKHRSLSETGHMSCTNFWLLGVGVTSKHLVFD